MKPVNLLPDQYRPRRAAGGLQGSAYVVLAVLGGLLVMVALYVVSANQVSSRKEQTARARTELAAANARARTLTAFGDFSQIKATRTSSVQGLAAVRFDWERLMREIALVMPAGTWITDVDATTVPADPTAGSATGAASAAGAESTGGPTATLTGCARHQPDVARLMVRLRKVHEVEDVALKDSQKQGAGSTGTSGPPPGATPGAASGCGSFYGFDLLVSFAPPAAAPTPAGPQKVPASLGGGE